MIRDLSATLEALLLSQVQDVEVDFVRPTDPYSLPQGHTALNLFLYDVRENVELRNNEPVVRRQGGQAVIEPPPMRVECTYLVTAWPEQGADLALREHHLLTQALAAFSRFPTIPEEFLQGDLVGQAPPLPMITAHADGLKNPAEFWTAVGNRLRASLTVTATVSLAVRDAATAPLVTTRRSGFTPTGGPVDEEWVQIGGEVLGESGAPTQALRASATATSASSNQAILQTPAQAAQFRVGDILFLQDPGVPGHNDRARLTEIFGDTLTFAGALSTPAYPAGTAVRVADLDRGQTTIRADDSSGIEPGAFVRITQGGVSELREVAEVDADTEIVTLVSGLTNVYSMDSADPAVVLQPERAVAGALVDVLGTGLRTRTDTEGRYTFARVPAGPHTLRVMAVGFQPLTRPIQAPAGPHQDYNALLQPL